jgi:threonine dehydratase
LNQRFSFEDIETAYAEIDDVFLNTPQFECEPLSEMFNCRVILKVETLNPIRSFKGRGASLLVKRSTQRKLICASAGNFGQAMAWSCRGQKELTVYASVHANAFKVARMKELGAKVIQEGGDFDTAKAIAKDVAAKSNIRFVEDSLDIETVVGAGTIGYEFDASRHIDAVLVPLGNGALANGISVGIRYFSPDTKVIAIQSKNASAMIESWQSGKVVVHDKIETIADGIGVRVPVPQALDDMKDLVHQGLLVSEGTLIRAMRLIQFHAGILIEPSAAVGLAAIIENPELFRNKTVALILTGSNLTEEQIKNWF